MVHEWKFGDWAESPLGIVRFVTKGVKLTVLCEDCLLRSIESRYVKHLPECTGFDWKPEEPKPAKMVSDEAGPGEVSAYFFTQSKGVPDGYRLLERDERIVEGDICVEIGSNGKTTGWRDCGKLCVGHSVGFRIDNFGAVCFARKIETPPIVPPEGYRLLDSDEKVLNGDLYLHLGEWKLSYQSGGRLVRDIVGKLNNAPIEAYARKIETAMKPPKGYRWLSDGERTEIGDLFLLDGKTWEPVRNPEVYKST